jgi:hypothetical protein
MSEDLFHFRNNGAASTGGANRGRESTDQNL